MFSLNLNKAFSTGYGLESLARLSSQIQCDLPDNSASIDNEFEAICQRLKLHDGEKLLDIGGELVLYAARRHSARVLGLTLNRNLHIRLNQRIAGAGLQGSAVKFMDYRDLTGVRFEKAVCLNPFTVTKQNAALMLFGNIYNLLNPGGMLLTRCITTLPTASSVPAHAQSHLAHSIRSIFQTSHDEFLSGQTLELLVRQPGFEIDAVEDLTANYLDRLQRWLDSLQNNQTQPTGDAGETLHQKCMTVLPMIIHRMQSRALGVFEYLLAKSYNSRDKVTLPDSQRCCGLRSIK